MAAINSKFINAGGIHGEFSVSDLLVFPNDAELKHVARFWESVVAQSLLLDRAHAASIGQFESAAEQTEDPESAAEAVWRAEVLKFSDQNLVRANIIFLLLSFFEYALLEVYKLRFGEYPAAQKPRIFKDVIHPLKMDGVIGDVPPIFTREIKENRDEVRNAFAHGRWGALKEATEGIDMYEAFSGVASYLWHVEENLREKGFKP